MAERLHKLLARAGYAGRLKCEELILQGHVTVNGRTVKELGIKVDPDSDTVEVLGEAVRVPDTVCYILHKPADVVSTTNDPAGRRRATDYFRSVDVRLWPVGRLDADSTGLLLMTNDGELANKLTHPRYGVEKTYVVEVDGTVTRETCDGLLAGVWLAEGKARAVAAKVLHAARKRSIVEVVLKEGRNRQLRRMFAKFGHPVKRLRRVKMGPLTLGDLKAGEYRRLTDAEVAHLRRYLAEARAAAGPEVGEYGTVTPRHARDRKGPGRGLRSGPGRGAPRRPGKPDPAAPPGTAPGSKAADGPRPAGPRTSAARRSPRPAGSGERAGPRKPASGEAGPRKPGSGKPASGSARPREADFDKPSLRKPVVESSFHSEPRRPGPTPRSGNDVSPATPDARPSGGPPRPFRGAGGKPGAKPGKKAGMKIVRRRPGP